MSTLIPINYKINNNDTNDTNDTNTNTIIDKEYYNYVKEPLEKKICIIDSQINCLKIEDLHNTFNLINNLKINIQESIISLIEFDKILTNRFEILNSKKEILIENIQNLENINLDDKIKNTKSSKSSKSSKTNKILKIVKTEKKNKANKNELDNINLVNEIKINLKELVETKIKLVKQDEIVNQKIQIKIIEPKYCQQSNILELNNKLTNLDQQTIINRISTDSDYAKVYLQNFKPNTDPKKKGVKGIIKILGNFNKIKRIREEYEVKVFDADNKGTFWCTCADHKFNSGKKNIVCKHICFIVCKVLKILQTYFFDTKRLTPEHLTQLLDKFNINSDIWTDVKIVRKSNKITIQDFKFFPIHIEDTCTFCYDDMTDNDKPISVSCPLCKHCFHEECMEIWLESQSKCSFCSNNFWQYYKRIVAGEQEIDLECNQL